MLLMAIGGLSVDFTAKELKQRISVVVSYLLIGMNSVFVLWIIATFVWLMVRLLPDSRVVLTLQALAGYGAVRWLFSDSLWIPLVLASGQAVFCIGMRVLWDAAVRRLEVWEES